MAETAKSNIQPISIEKPDCTHDSDSLGSDNTSNNATSDLTEVELLDLRNSESNDELRGAVDNGERGSESMQNGLDEVLEESCRGAPEGEDTESCAHDTIGEPTANGEPTTNGELTRNGAGASITENSIGLDSAESAVANNKTNSCWTSGAPPIIPSQGGENTCIEGASYEEVEKSTPGGTGSTANCCVSDVSGSSSQHIDHMADRESMVWYGGTDRERSVVEAVVPIGDSHRNEFCNGPADAGIPPEAESLSSATSLDLVESPAEAEPALAPHSGLRESGEELEEDDMDAVNHQNIQEPQASRERSKNNATESQLAQHFPSDSGYAPDRATPPTNITAAQNDHYDVGGDVVESLSTESMNNAPEDEQRMQDVVMVTTDQHSDATPSDDVVPCGEECSEEDQFINPIEEESDWRVAGISDLPEVEPTSAHRRSCDDHLCVETDTAVQPDQPEPQTSEVASQPSVSSTKQCFELECDQSGKHGNPDLTPELVARTQNYTSLGSLESIELHSTKEAEFGDFVQSEPSSSQHTVSDSPAGQHKTLLALADECELDPSKLNPEDLIQVSRCSSSNQSFDSSYDMMARSLESEDDDDFITVTSYRELLKRYTKLREQKENEEGCLPSLSPSDIKTGVETLRAEIDQKQQELTKVQEKLEHHDEAAKRAIFQLQTEMKTRVDQVTKMYEEVLSEKDSTVVKFAQQELKNTEIIRKQEAMEARSRDMAKDREVLITKLKGAGVDKNKLSAQLHAKHAELINTQKEVHKFKDALSSQDVKVKWAHNKLKNEIESHKETKTSLERTMIKLKEAREETETIRRNCQQMIKTYQDSEDIKSNSLDQKLKEKMAQMRQDRQERRDQDEVHQMVVNELEALKRKHKDALEEIQGSKDKLICLEQERSTQEKCISSYRDSLHLTKRENQEMASRLVELENIAQERDRANTECDEMCSEMDQIRQQDKEYAMEAENCRARETQLLELTEKLTNKNALLQSENTGLNTRNSAALSEAEHLKNALNESNKNRQRLREDLHDQHIKAKEEIDKLTKSLDDKTRLSEELKRTVEDKKDEVKVTKRRQAAAIKDLTRQLQQAKRRCEAQEPASSDKADSLGSRTSSSNSLDTMPPANQDRGDVAYPGADTPIMLRTEMFSMAETPTVRHVEPDKQMLIERIVKLQRINARKSEKIEFLEDHINQLLLEIKKKNRLIQDYVVREESGALASNTSDNVKAQMSKKGGIMASLYSSHSSDQTMTLDLSLQINSKLQAVLEDTLLKNITLKENIDTLGAEIARLSQENRRLQLETVSAS